MDDPAALWAVLSPEALQPLRIRVHDEAEKQAEIRARYERQVRGFWSGAVENAPTVPRQETAGARWARFGQPPNPTKSLRLQQNRLKPTLSCPAGSEETPLQRA